MGEIGNWLLPVVVVLVLAVGTLVFALFIGRWIDAQGNTVVDEPRRKPRRRDLDAKSQAEQNRPGEKD